MIGNLVDDFRSPHPQILKAHILNGSEHLLDFFNLSTAGRLILTDHALYFEALRLVTFDKPKVYELADDLKQIIKPELTGPWGSRLFDKAVMYKSISL